MAWAVLRQLKYLKRRRKVDSQTSKFSDRRYGQGDVGLEELIGGGRSRVACSFQVAKPIEVLRAPES